MAKSNKIKLSDYAAGASFSGAQIKSEPSASSSSGYSNTFEVNQFGKSNESNSFKLNKDSQSRPSEETGGFVYKLKNE